MPIITVMLFFGLLLVGCGNNSLETSSAKAVSAELEARDTSTVGKTPSLSPTQSLSETKGDDMINSTMEVKTSLPGMEIFNFSSDEPAWYTVDDRVMGGVSRSSVSIRDSNVLGFSGTMSLDRNGGFSSARSDWEPMNLDGFDGILLRVLGDGNIYRLRIRTTETGSEISYNAAFDTSSEEWQLVYVPFKDMVPTYRGFVMDVDPLKRFAVCFLKINQLYKPQNMCKCRYFHPFYFGLISGIYLTLQVLVHLDL